MVESIRRQQRTKLGHGTVACYARGCRLPSCRSAWADYMRLRRSKTAKRPRGFYDGRTVHFSGNVTPFAREILSVACERNRKGSGEIIEQLLREHGGEVTVRESAEL